jgi:VanZ family protein
MKSSHAFFFGVLAVLFYRALVGEGLTRKRAAIRAIIFTVLYGASDEFHQMFTQGREARVRDVFIDGIGATVVIYLIYWFLPKLPKKIQIFLLEFGIT